MTDKVQAYLTPKKGKEEGDFGGIWGFGETFIPYLVQYLPSLRLPVKKGHL